jgi:hypothetical protein
MAGNEMTNQRSKACFEEVAKILEDEYIVNPSIRGDPDRDKELFLYLLKNLAALLKLSWGDMNVDYRASQLSKYPPYCTTEEMLAAVARMEEGSRQESESHRRFSEMLREAGYE